MDAKSTAATNAKNFLTIGQALNILNIGRTKFYELRRAKSFPEYRIPSRRGPFFLEEDLRAFFEGGTYASYVGTNRAVE